ncbi:MAG: AAA family ATPase [Treponema sp.]|jgi:chaperone BCS1|nr:AAA family ATPase [Treponema sp.]
MDKQTLIAGIITMCGTAVLISFRQIILNGFWWLTRIATTTIEISNTHVIFHTLMEYLERTTALKLRAVRFMNGPWGQLPYTTISVGSGLHFIQLFGRIALVVLSENPQSMNHWMGEKLSVRITILGKHPEFVSRLRDALDETSHRISYYSESMMKVYTYKGDEKYGNWTDTLSIHKRNMNTIYIPTVQKNRIIAAIKEFHQSESNHYQKGVPHHLGVMFYGPPGTGKTSLIQALASHFDVHICYLHSSELRYIQNAIALLPKNAWLIIEDIDSNNVIHPQTDDTTEAGKTRRIEKNGALAQVEFNLGQILNCWDGMLSAEGRILFITTNRPEKIDPVLLRPGRIDIREEIGYVDRESLSQFCESFYGKAANFDIKPQTTVCALQNAVIVDKLPFEDFKERFIYCD